MTIMNTTSSTFTITNGGYCENSGEITNNSNSSFSFSGSSFTTNQVITNNLAGTMTFNSDFTSTGQSIQNYGYFTIDGGFTNSSEITNGMLTYSTPPNTFTITNGGYCENSGIITNNSNSSFSFSGSSFTTNQVITNNPVGTMTFNSDFTSTGQSIQNYGYFNINGIFTNSSKITNGNAMIALPITFTITNGGYSENTGEITNNGGGYFSFTGTSFTINQNITNSGTATMYFYSSLALTSGAIITNNGIIKCSAPSPYPTAQPYPITGFTGPTGIWVDTIEQYLIFFFTRIIIFFIA